MLKYPSYLKSLKHTVRSFKKLIYFGWYECEMEENSFLLPLIFFARHEYIYEVTGCLC